MALLTEEALTAYKDLSEGLYRYILLSISPYGIPLEVRLAHTAPPESTYATFRSSLPPSHPRFGIFGYDDEGPLVMVVWCPDTACIKDKMLLASSLSRVRSELLTKVDSIGLCLISATDPSECEEGVVLDKLRYSRSTFQHG